MKYKDFRDFRIVRNCDEKYDDYTLYKKYLAIDFKHRCAYCNMLDSTISENYHIDHFIPRKAVEKTDMEKLLCDYNNLMYCCPKCNLSKKAQYEGDIHDGTYNNLLFYNPVLVDYNFIFYRNEYGGISSEDDKGKKMITRLKLYSPIYHLSFLIEEINDTLNKISSKIDNLDDAEKLYYLKAYRKLGDFLKKIKDLFNCNYYDNSVKNIYS